MNRIVVLVFMYLWSVFPVDAEVGFVFRHPGPYPEGMDTWYGSVHGKTANHDGRMIIGGYDDQYDSLIRFDLSGLPQEAVLARIYLYHLNVWGDSKRTPINWFLLNSQWQSGTVGWDNSPSGFRILEATMAPEKEGWYAFDCTYFYNQWRRGEQSSLNYGLKLTPRWINNWFDIFQSSSTLLYPWARPYLYVWYEKGSDDNVIKLKWPVGVPKPSSPSSSFGSDWGLGESSCKGLSMKHAGVDIPASVGTPVYTCEDGFVREILTASQTGGWASAIVIEHQLFSGDKYTSVYWHVDPVSIPFVNTVTLGDFVPKGYQIATVANLSPKAGSHLHFGIRLGAYRAGLSNKGALPAGICSELPTHPESFINPWDTSKVSFK